MVVRKETGKKEKMKKFLLIVLIGIVVFLTTCFVAFSSYKVHVLQELKQKDDNINKVWSSLYKKSSNRLMLIEKLSNVSECDKSIDSMIIKNKNNRDPNKVDEFWDLEYNTNKVYLQLKECFEDKAINDPNLSLTNFNAEKLNKVVENYNANVLDFNKYYSTFPNFIFGSKKGYKRKKFFYLKYGEDNEEYYNQKKKTEKWVETGKWE